MRREICLLRRTEVPIESTCYGFTPEISREKEGLATALLARKSRGGPFRVFLCTPQMAECQTKQVRAN